MLAPLKERAVRDNDAGAGVGPAPSGEAPLVRALVTEIDDLRRALRESRSRLRRGAWESTRQIAALNAEVSRLQMQSAADRRQLARYESGAAIIELGRKLMQLSDANHQLNGVAHRVWTLEKTVAAAHDECQRLAAARDALAQQLHLAGGERRER